MNVQELEINAILVDYFRASQNALYRVAYSCLHDREAALDAVQDTIVQALSHVDSLRGPDGIKPWIYRILINECRQQLRRGKRGGGPALSLEEIPEPVAADEAPARSERLDVLRAVDTLEPALRTIVVLRFFEDMKLSDIALVTHTNLNTVKARLYTALNRLRAVLGPFE